MRLLLLRMRTLYWVILSCLLAASVPAQTPAGDHDGLLLQATTFLKQEKLAEALQAGQAAVKAAPTRHEAHGVIALILSAQGKHAEAQASIEQAIRLAPAEKQAKLRELAARLKGMAAAPSPVPAPSTLPPEARRKLDVLGVIAEEADKAELAAERQKALREYLEKSAEFLKSYPDQTGVWAVRAAAALELNQSRTAWEAGRKLVALGAEKADDAKTRKVLALLDRKGLLTNTEPPAGPKADEKYENSLGMKFVPVPGTQVFFCIWKTRVKDFEAFASATGHDAAEGMWSLDPAETKFKQLGHTWKNPGFEQTPLHPVCGVNFADAQAFCRWLTEKDRKAGLIGDQQSYRLPTDAEWSVAVGRDKFPWGDQWPPPQGAGNYADESSDLKNKIEGYRDGYNRTSPVGSFRENKFGLYDLGGNLWEWCEDWYRADMNTEEVKKAIPALADDKGGQTYRVLRGGAWVNTSPVRLASGFCLNELPLIRNAFNGFRCVLVVGVGSR